MTVDELGSFTRLYSGLSPGPKWTGIAGTSPLPDFVADVVAGYGEGFVAKLLLNGPYLTQENASASALGVGPSGILGPLQGAVVHDNPGLLQAYENVYQYRTASAASSELHRYTDLNFPGISTFTFAGLTGIDEARTVEYVLGPDNGQNEHDRRFLIRAGTVFIDVSLLSGATLPLDDALRYALPSIRRILGACPSQS